MHIQMEEQQISGNLYCSNLTDNQQNTKYSKRKNFPDVTCLELAFSRSQIKSITLRLHEIRINNMNGRI